MSEPIKVTKFKDLPKQDIKKVTVYLIGRKRKDVNGEVTENIEFLERAETRYRLSYNSYISNIKAVYDTSELAETYLKTLITAKKHLKYVLKVYAVKMYEGYKYDISGRYTMADSHHVSYKKVLDITVDSFSSLDDYLKEFLKDAKQSSDCSYKEYNKEKDRLKFIMGLITEKDFNKDLETILTEENA